MPTMRLMTYNVENMLVRFNFRRYEVEGLVTLLDVDSEADRANLVRTYWNVINDENRVFTALTVSDEATLADGTPVAAPDIICVQEVENLRALRAFHDRYLRRLTHRDYEYSLLIEGNDPRGIDVAALSRFRIASATTHQERKAKVKTRDEDGNWVERYQRVFRRDCLELRVKKQNKILPIFVCHFKSMSGGRPNTKPTREAEAAEVRKIIEEAFPDPAQADWVVVGDLNDYTETDGTADSQHALGALLDDGFAIDIVKQIPDPKQRWTHYYASKDSYHQLDYILLSPALAAKNQGTVPQIIRNGQPFRAKRYDGPRWPRIGYDRPKASDHCPVVADLKY